MILLGISGSLAAAAPEAEQESGAVLQGAEPQATVQVRLEPASVTFGTCRKTFTVKVYDVENLYGAQYRIEFDPAVLQVVDANRDLAGVQIGSAEMFASKRTYEINTVDNAIGRIDYLITCVSSTSVSGTGNLGTITFQVKEPGTSALEFVTEGGYCELSKPAGAGDLAIPATWNDANVTATGSCPKLLLPLVTRNRVW